VANAPVGGTYASVSLASVAGDAYGRLGINLLDAPSDATVASRVMPSGVGVDTDGDGMPDDWESRYGLNPLDPSDALADNDHDGVSNLQEYLDGTDPNVVVPPVIKSVAYLLDGCVQLAVDGERGHSYTLRASTNLRDWSNVAGFVSTNSSTVVADPTATNYLWRFYRVVIP
jgi:hypothetical protein